MNILDALLVEGTSYREVLCYGVFNKNEINEAYDNLLASANSTESKVHRLLWDEWPNGVLLNAVEVGGGEDIVRSVSDVLAQMFIVGACVGAVCMYDGVFGGYEDIFSPSVAEQIYAFSFDKESQVINFDSDFISSKEWSSWIASCRYRMSHKGAG